MTPAFDNLLLVMAVAFAAPLVLGLFPRIQLPSVVVEIVAGIVIGPSVLGLAEVDESVQVVALIGLAFVLFLAGLEIEFEKLRGAVLRLTAAGFALSFAIAVGVSLVLSAGGLVDTPLLVAIILCATSLGVLVPVLKDAGEIGSTFGQLIIAAATIADFGAIILLSLFFSGEGGTGSTLVLLGSLFTLAAVVLVAVRGAEHSMRIRADLLRLQDTTAQIRVRAALLLFVGFAAVAEALGLEVILGAFVAGAIVSVADRDQAMTHPDFRRKLEAIGFGFFIPVFFVSSGVRFDLAALTSSA
jgi:Kef-type K+ transport system membrane component KefB